MQQMPSPTSMGDPYDVLNINKDSTPEKIRKAYKALVRMWQPDKHPSSSKPRPETNFKTIPEDYQVLGDDDCKKRMFTGVYSSPDAGSVRRGSRWASPSPSIRHHRQKDADVDPPMPRSASARRPSGHSSRASMAWGSSVLSPGARQGAVEDASYLPRSTSARRASSFYTTSTATTTSPTTGAKTSTMFFKKKPPPIERSLECTLEELFKGCKKEVRFTRDVIGKNGMITKKEEVEIVRVKPGWKKGTLVTFEEKGDERPGSLPADVVFVIAEKEHPYFQRMDNDLVVEARIPLVTALTGGRLTFRQLNGEKFTCILDEGEVIPPGHEKVIKGDGMPITGRKGARGDLRVRFEVVFPERIGADKKKALREVLRGFC